MDSIEAREQQLPSNTNIGNPNATELPMGDGGDQSQAPSEPTVAQEVERPEWLPEKFKTPEDMANAYTSLEKKMGAPAQEEQEASTQEGIPEIQPAEDASDGADSVGEEASTLSGDFSKYTQEFDTEGQLSEESYKELAEKHSLSKELVDAHIQGQIALRNKYKAKSSVKLEALSKTS